ncbi:putative RNA polymerase subunit RPO18 [Parapoxvirus red deer/HL953]|uniref:DNA-directed RNA polymerase 18 kDa subunit n=1 Tax=Parapoxvirus red deer/HL953 TaxID=1579460 RepID=A0A0A7MET5_9POXV|nr:putative RNA polymerase subunit RPO18 [Parapoxvirus red deer/HL953]AIZ77321.1 putative RNA polymerase subunit RPO18 [Parapoxvirus red deer/HL953]
MSTFRQTVYLPVTLQPHELTLDFRGNVTEAVMREYLYKEKGGLMATDIEVCLGNEMPLARIVSNAVVVSAPCNVTFKYYRVGDSVRGKLHIEDETNVFVDCGDLICQLGRSSGAVTFNESKYCLVRGGAVYENGSEVSAVLREARSGRESAFVFSAVLSDEPAAAAAGRDEEDPAPVAAGSAARARK